MAPVPVLALPLPHLQPINWCQYDRVGLLWPNVGWIRMPLGTEVGLGPGDIVLDGDPAPLMKRGTAAIPTFGPMSFVAKQLPISATAELLFSFV